MKHDGLTVRAGSAYLYDSDSSLHLVNNAYYSPNSCKGLAIIKISRGFQFNRKIQPVKFDNNGFITKNTVGRILNWSSKNAYDDMWGESNQLQIFEIFGLDKQCKESYRFPWGTPQSCKFDCIPQLGGNAVATHGAPYIIKGKLAGFITYTTGFINEPLMIELLSSSKKLDIINLIRGDNENRPSILIPV